MNIIKGGIYTQMGGIHYSLNDKCNLVIIVNADSDYSEIDFILYHKEARIFVKETCFLLHKRLSTPTFSDVLKCGDIINPKYKILLKEFLEELVNV